MCFEIKLNWVEDKMPLLKDIDVQSLSGGKKHINQDDIINNNKNQGVSEYVWYNYRAKAINQITTKNIFQYQHQQFNLFIV